LLLLVLLVLLRERASGDADAGGAAVVAGLPVGEERGRRGGSKKDAVMKLLQRDAL